jgi:hypothetical protein
VDVAAGRGLRGIEVAVGIDPHQANGAALRRRGYGADADAVVTTQKDGKSPRPPEQAL